MNLKQMLKNSEADNYQKDYLKIFSLIYFLQITKLIIVNTECLLRTSHCVQQYTLTTSFNPHHISVRWILMLLFYR